MLTQPQTFPCPHCQEIINDSMRQCPHCSTLIDPEAARIAAALQSNVNQACSDASFLRNAAAAMFVFLGLSFIPFLPTYWGFVITFVLVIGMFIRWQIKFGSLQTRDPDYARAQRLKNVALVLWFVAIPVGFVVRPLLGEVIARLLAG